MKKRKAQWERAIERIQNYCRKHIGCGGCRIQNLCNRVFREPPEDWTEDADETGDM